MIKDERVAFLLVGAVNTIAGGVWFALIDWLIGAYWGGFGHYVTLALTYVAAILTAFVLYRRLVFRVQGNVVHDLIRFATVYLGAFLLNLVLFALLHSGVGIAPLTAQVINIAVTTILAFLLHKNFSFGHHAGKPSKARRTQ